MDYNSLVYGLLLGLQAFFFYLISKISLNHRKKVNADKGFTKINLVGDVFIIILMIVMSIYLIYKSFN